MYDFNPRPLRRGRRSAVAPSPAPSIFQSTPPAKGATSFKKYLARTVRFQSTPPAKGATSRGDSRSLRSFGHFNPRPLRRGRPAAAELEGGIDNISIHAPCEGGDPESVPHHHADIISIHAPCEGGDAWTIATKVTGLISIHAPCEGGDSKNSQKNRLNLYKQNKYPRNFLRFRFYPVIVVCLCTINFPQIRCETASFFCALVPRTESRGKSNP